MDQIYRVLRAIHCARLNQILNLNNEWCDNEWRNNASRAMNCADGRDKSGPYDGGIKCISWEKKPYADDHD